MTNPPIRYYVAAVVPPMLLVFISAFLIKGLDPAVRVIAEVPILVVCSAWLVYVAFHYRDRAEAARYSEGQPDEHRRV